MGGVVCAGLGPAFVLGADVTVAAVVGALVLVIACLLRRPRLVGWRLLPWPLVLGVSVLFVLVEIAHAYGLTTLVTELVGQGDTWTDLLRLAGISAVAANLLVAAFVSRPNLRRLVGLAQASIDDDVWKRRARRQRYVAYGMAAATGVIGFLMSTKPELW